MVLWSLHVYVTLDQTWPDERCFSVRIEVRHPKLVPGCFRSWALLCFWFFWYAGLALPWRRFHRFCFNLLIFLFLFSTCRCEGGGGGLWVLKTKIKAHYLWLQTTGTRAGQMDNWQVSLRVNWGWLCGKQGAFLPDGGVTEPSTDTKEPTLHLKILSKSTGANVPCADVGRRSSVN